MKVIVKCPKCGCDCKKVLDKTMSINKDILFVCPIHKDMIIPIRIFKTKTSKLW